MPSGASPCRRRSTTDWSRCRYRSDASGNDSRTREQTIICTGGRGWYQEEGKDAIEMKPGDAIAIPVEVRHWHGAAKDSWFSHIVVYSKAHEGFHAEWCEPVPQEIYDGLE